MKMLDLVTQVKGLSNGTISVLLKELGKIVTNYDELDKVHNEFIQFCMQHEIREAISDWQTAWELMNIYNSAVVQATKLDIEIDFGEFVNDYMNTLNENKQLYETEHSKGENFIQWMGDTLDERIFTEGVE